MPDQFWQMTPREFMKYLNAHSKKEARNEERQLELAAFVVASIYNQPPVPVTMVKYKKRKPAKIEDFIKKPQEKRVQSPEEMLAVVKALNKSLGGLGGD